MTVVNLDPANENISYKCGIDINELVNVSEVSERLNLGPNGGMVYAIEYLEKNMDWLINNLEKDDSKYFLFDCPGQVELFTHHDSYKNIFQHLTESLNYRVTAVNLVDSHYCTEASLFVSVLLMSLSTMMQLGLPHVNVLSKVDMLKKYKKLGNNQFPKNCCPLFSLN